MGTGSDTIDMNGIYNGGSPTTTDFTVNGSDPTAAVGDTLKLDFTGVTSIIILATTSTGSVTVGGYGSVVNWTSIETWTLTALQQTVPNGTLYVQGEAVASDLIAFTETTGGVPSNATMNVRVGNTVYGPYPAINQLLSDGRGGTDKITIETSNLTQIPATFYGQAGDDYLSGAKGNDILEGGIGNDTIYGQD